MPAHTKGSVDDRVDSAIAWADAAIAIITPDARGVHGAPNVIDEIGRWRGGREKETICILSQNMVKPYSNHAGIVRPEFKDRIKEVFEEIRGFLASLPSISDDGDSTSGGPAETDSFKLETSRDYILLDSKSFVYSSLDETDGNVIVTMSQVSSSDANILRRIGTGTASIRVAFGDVAMQASVVDHAVQRNNATNVTLKLRSKDASRSRVASDVAWGGTPPLDANQIARLRATRILFNEPPPTEGHAWHSNNGAETLIRGGMSGLPILKSPVIEELENLPRQDQATWVHIRLLMIAHLCLSNCVEHVDKLSLTVSGGRLKRIEFRGTRWRVYGTVPPFVIEIDQAVDL